MTKPICETEVEVRNPEGLHMRPAMQFVDLANSFESDITVSNRHDTVDAKSIMQMTMLAATFGTRLKIRAVGTDAREAVDALRDLFDRFAPESLPKTGEKEGH
ncbi:MAG: HPr family phosphocarrier protein [Planctomycetaceae bacterium]|nr:HPr family phosphocarrier protein [Planctomycetaceae bacterium]